MGNLSQHTAVVTGGAQGIGLAVAQALVAEGARVVIADLDGALADAAAESLGLGRACGVPCDVTSAIDVEAAIETAVSSGVRPPTSSPIGACRRARSSSEKPSSLSRIARSSFVRRDPIAPR